MDWLFWEECSPTEKEVFLPFTFYLWGFSLSLTPTPPTPCSPEHTELEPHHFAGSLPFLTLKTLA